jgi:nucleoside recognition membrane protein YjiH
MGLAVFVGIVVVAVAAGIAVQLAERKVGYDWLVIAVTGTFGAYFASETFPGSTTFGAIKDFGPTIDGFYVIPGIVTGVLLALVAYLGTKNLGTTKSPA